MTTTTIKRLGVVALTRDMPEHRLVRGQIGIVMEILEPGVFEVDFRDNNGSTRSFRLTSSDLVRLHQAVNSAA